MRGNETDRATGARNAMLSSRHERTIARYADGRFTFPTSITSIPRSYFKGMH